MCEPTPTLLASGTGPLGAETPAVQVRVFHTQDGYYAQMRTTREADDGAIELVTFSPSCVLAIQQLYRQAYWTAADDMHLALLDAILQCLEQLGDQLDTEE